ncbi:putative damage-inducible protein DinB [Paenibacillus taihuensis]|uniref:Putative damage-inducible protein DinB n=1 Tax=Paenibacillus taihuensis TaxID=1156355 RepID=A0A3D9Q6K8_9BACL|nr:DinB family protein [Paenibacillus taihuensis]REE56313.1 putative damage-inducible protein DinB [Paenibacillus taihuensis]
MFTSVQDFIKDYSRESQSTQKLLDSLTDESLGQEILPGLRTLGILAWHLIHDDKGMVQQIGIKFKAPAAHSEHPQSAAVIAQTYRETTAALLEAASQWSDDRLQESNNLFGQTWKNGFTLFQFIKHEVHHRGQMTILMRQAGLPIAGVYGPSKEEWERMGMTAPV